MSALNINIFCLLFRHYWVSYYTNGRGTHQFCKYCDRKRCINYDR